MPFTPFHLGPGAAFKAIGGRHFSFMVFGGSQILMDIEPLVRIIMGTPTLHGFTHTVPGALLVGAVATAIGKPISAAVLAALKVGHYPLSWLAAFTGAFAGTLSHVVLDSVMHWDVRPGWPLLSGNALLGVWSVEVLHIICLALGTLGGISVAIRYFIRGRV